MKLKVDLKKLSIPYTTSTTYRVGLGVGFVIDAESKLPNAANSSSAVITTFADTPVISQSTQKYPYESASTRFPVATVASGNRGFIYAGNTNTNFKLYNVSTTAAVTLVADIPSTSTRVQSYNNTTNIDLFGYLEANKKYYINTDTGFVEDIYKFKSTPITSTSTFTMGSYVSFRPDLAFEPTLTDTLRNSAQSNSYYAVMEGNYQVSQYKNGRIKIYKKSDNSLYRTINNPAPEFGTSFIDPGYAIALSDSYLVWGQSNYPDPALSGRVFVVSLATGELVRTFSATTKYQADYYGNDVDIDGDQVIVGKFNESRTQGSNNTYVYSIASGALIYTLTNATGQHTAITTNYYMSVGLNNSYLYNRSNASIKYTWPKTLTFDTYGDRSIMVQGGDTYTSPNVIIYSNSTGSQLFSFTDPDPQYQLNTTAPRPVSSRFGSSISIGADYAVVGASGYRYSDSTVDAGKAYVYRLSDGALVYQIDNPRVGGSINVYNNKFGDYVSILGNTIIIDGFVFKIPV